MKEFFIHILAL